jgi:hypothetical protein
VYCAPVRKLVVFLVIVVLVVGAVDFLARALAERRIAETMQSELDLAREPGVGIEAFPFTLALIGGNFPEVMVIAQDVGRGGVELDRTQITFRDVEFSVGQLLSGEKRLVRIGSARGTGTLSGEDVTAALEEAGVSATVEFRDGTVVLTSDELEGEVQGELAVEGGALVILPAAAQLPDVELPTFSRGLSYEEIDIRGSRAVVTFTLNRRRFRF